LIVAFSEATDPSLLQQQQPNRQVTLTGDTPSNDPSSSGHE
jgi:hypothetical protein